MPAAFDLAERAEFLAIARRARDDVFASFSLVSLGLQTYVCNAAAGRKRTDSGKLDA